MGRKFLLKKTIYPGTSVEDSKLPFPMTGPSG